jgi:RNA-directed DNA polymerase
MPEPMGKLDTVEVNGPEGEVLDWDAVDWRRIEDDVRRLRQRIFTATQQGDLQRVRNLQKLIHTHCQRRLPDGSAGAPVLCSPD